jgi:hypothetical protein
MRLSKGLSKSTDSLNERVVFVGLQNLHPRFKSGRRLQFCSMIVRF